MLSSQGKWQEFTTSYVRFTISFAFTDRIHYLTQEIMCALYKNSGNRSSNNVMWSPNRSPSQQNQQSFNNTSTHFWSRTQNNAQQIGSAASPNRSNNNSFNSPYKSYSKDEVITDEHGLQKYLRYVHFMQF